MFVGDEEEILLKDEEPFVLEAKESLLIEGKEPLLHPTKSLDLLTREIIFAPLSILFLIALYGISQSSVSP